MSEPNQAWWQAALQCPITRTPLEFVADAGSEGEWQSTGATRYAYPVRGGIPVLLPSEARKLL